MNVLLFGATGMIGQGVLRECLKDPGVTRVVSVARRTTGTSHPKLREVLHADFRDFGAIAADLSGHDVCFFCLGTSSAGMNEADYRRVTYDVALAAANALLAGSPEVRFIFVSGAGTDSTGRGRTMWARVKGQTENALLKLPFTSAFMVRPAYIQPRHGILASGRLTRVMYRVLGVFYPVLKALAPGFATTTEDLGRAMLHLARHGGPKAVLESRDLVQYATAARAVD